MAISKELMDMSMQGILGAASPNAQQTLPESAPPVETQSPAEGEPDTLSLEIEGHVAGLGELMARLPKSAAAKVSKALDILESITL